MVKTIVKTITEKIIEMKRFITEQLTIVELACIVFALMFIILL